MPKLVIKFIKSEQFNADEQVSTPNDFNDNYDRKLKKKKKRKKKDKDREWHEDLQCDLDSVNSHRHKKHKKHKKQKRGHSLK